MKKKQEIADKWMQRIMDNFGTLDYSKITPDQLVQLKRKYPDNFDYLEQNENSDRKTIIDFYSFNLYEKSHYKVMNVLSNKWWLDWCTQLVLGCYIHDQELYDNFMKHWFPNKVKDLKIIHYQYMGQSTKIWYDDLFRSNAGRVTNEVRLCSLKLKEYDIIEIFQIFNHVKSIWFLNCELDINGPIPFAFVYYQIEMLSIIDCRKNFEK